MKVAPNNKAFTRTEHSTYTGTGIPLIYIGDPNSRLGRLALEQLQRNGFAIRILPAQTHIVLQLEQDHPSLVLIETPLRSGSSGDLCRRIRCVDSLAGIPVIALAKDPSQEERVLLLESGADDYIGETSSVREILARVRAVMRRFARQSSNSWMAHISPPFLHSFVGNRIAIMRTGDLEIDPAAMRVLVRGIEIETTNLEFRFLHYLMQNQGRVFTREQLLDAIWGSQNVEIRSVDACVRRLRRKIELVPLHPVYVKTIRGAGYSLRTTSAMTTPA